MLSKTALVKARKAVESLYDSKCTITEYQKFKKEDKSTGFQEKVVLADEPCKVSFKTINATKETDSASSVSQVVTVLLAPEIQVKPGSKLTITRKNVTTEYKSSGKPAVYNTHQAVVVELFEGWA